MMRLNPTGVGQLDGAEGMEHAFGLVADLGLNSQAVGAVAPA